MSLPSQSLLCLALASSAYSMVLLVELTASSTSFPPILLINLVFLPKIFYPACILGFKIARFIECFAYRNPASISLFKFLSQEAKKTARREKEKAKRRLPFWGTCMMIKPTSSKHYDTGWTKLPPAPVSSPKFCCATSPICFSVPHCSSVSCPPQSPLLALVPHAPLVLAMAASMPSMSLASVIMNLAPDLPQLEDKVNHSHIYELIKALCVSPGIKTIITIILNQIMETLIT